MYSSKYIYDLWPQSFYIARVVFQTLQCSWQAALYTSATIATLSTKGMFYFCLSLGVDPFLRWQALKSFSSTHRFQLGNIWSSYSSTCLLKKRTNYIYTQYRPSHKKPGFKNASLENKNKKPSSLGSHRLWNVPSLYRGCPDVSWPGVHSPFVLTSSIMPFYCSYCYCCACHPTMRSITFNLDHSYAFPT